MTTELESKVLTVNNANAAFKVGQFEKAATLYTKAAAMDTSDGGVQSNLCYALLKVGKYERALEAANSCVAINADSQKGHSRRALALLGMQQYEEAIAASQVAVAKALPNSPAQREAAEMVGRAKWFCKQTCEAKGQEVPAAAADAVDPHADQNADQKENRVEVQVAT
jgi:tetratricopeptide (TPR) repeat protein